MDPYQEQCFLKMKSGKNVFITGSGGTGKSFLIRTFKNEYPNKKHLAITSTTGISALEIEGTTLHSYLGIGLGVDNAETLFNKIKKNKFIRQKWTNLKTLVIDEVSMLNPVLLETLEELARLLRSNDKIFGGIQLILCGDFCQLPCVSKSSSVDSLFCFESKVWSKLNLNIFYLKKSYRQSDTDLFNILNECRLGSLSEESIKILKSRDITESSLNSLGDAINKESPIQPTKLFAINKLVDNINNDELSLLIKNTKESYTFPIIVSLASPSLEDKCSKYIQNMNVIEQNICVNTQIMITANIDLDGGVVNGSRGKIVGFIKDYDSKDPNQKIPIVKLKSGKTIIVNYHSQDVKDENDKLLFTIKYMPIRLAYAISIHKAQGLTLDCAQIDFSNIFEFGQAYVALSRIKSIDSLFLINFKPEKIKCHPKAKEFYENLKG